MSSEQSRLDPRAESEAEELGVLIDALLPVLVDRLEETGLGEIEVERNGATVRVRAEATPASALHAREQAVSAPVASAAAPVVNDRRHAIRSTAVGFVTLASDVHVGAKIARGALVASIDVLGVPNEVRAEHGGIVGALRCTTGDPVEYGQELFFIERVGEGGR